MHQTKQAASGVCKTVGPQHSEKQALVQELEAIVKEQAEIGPGTGVKRAIHWTGRSLAAGGQDGNVDSEAAVVPAAGNSANVAAAATASAGIVSHLNCLRCIQAQTDHVDIESFRLSNIKKMLLRSSNYLLNSVMLA